MFSVCFVVYTFLKSYMTIPILKSSRVLGNSGNSLVPPSYIEFHNSEVELRKSLVNLNQCMLHTERLENCLRKMLLTELAKRKEPTLSTVCQVKWV